MNASARPSRWPLLLLPVFGLALMSCGATRIASEWAARPMRIDGNKDDWGQTSWYRFKDQVSFAVANDSVNLYLCLVSTDQKIARQLRQGLATVWFDPDGGEDEVMGVRLPPTAPHGALAKREDPELEMQDLDPMDVELLAGTDTERLVVPNREENGVQLRIGHEKNVVIYELRMPLERLRAVSDHPLNRMPVAVGIGIVATVPHHVAEREHGRGGRRPPRRDEGGMEEPEGLGPPNGDGMPPPGMEPGEGRERGTGGSSLDLWMIVTPAGGAAATKPEQP